ncbi:16S rRNA (cytosine(1402)-N(4))-methyltransferase RsmH [Prosthecochloris sp. HL-130-GSB]|jgi:16S rRNA (cytosine1402-N4)-methyltransferase|uniref:16S rRNA (cytosine(1402)-N(4))-methyltransferase RsmH n=1 Tax=Prosthecochloris sp. HL-130-GSB TaxID=1974213 RepID=UPI000A1C0929|nr:16S rRNA (cytosine(1402)-N(4))-methyltransferase RsmH [Prosthecochloris sp. HL-130-GSB]ARM31746.1 16S rRNA (cytosine(1402)-N(4))-methyltransferase [Prosthecochloris sp. HL-130-GSB]
MKYDEYHLPVMADEITDFLVRRPGIYVDGTLGGGGHSGAMLRALERNGMLEGSLLVGIDQDTSALESAARRLAQFSGHIRLQKGNFSTMAAVVADIRSSMQDDLPVMGILLDLGVSSFQIDTPSRGFSFMRNGPLDMRMDQNEGVTAAELLCSTDEHALADLMFRYGEERKSRPIARAVKEWIRDRGEITTTAELAAIVKSVVKGHEHQVKSLARVFQALRIAVNDELGVLEAVLSDGAGLLAPCGRMAVISYHSLEDRMVKMFFRSSSEDDWGPKGVGLREPVHEAAFRVVTRKAVMASDDEVSTNPRARSARVRVLERKAEDGGSCD